MPKPRIYLDQPLATDERIALPEAAFRHLVQVLRLAAGESLVLFNGRGGEYEATLETVGKRDAQVRVGAHRTVDRESALRITLAQGISKGERMDWCVQKATETGVARIVPLVTEHCVVKLDAERWTRKHEHWQGVATSAAEQSGRTRVPAIEPVAAFSAYLKHVPAGALKVILDPDVESTLADIKPARDIVLLIGPEGGFSPAELQQAQQAGFTPLRLGPRILRTETAATVAMTVLQTLWGDLKC
ncbi:MAG: 16S rRNA (uracil(1498)-N(3))-methyltransferase [Pseudomonadota bacterium]